MTGDNLCIDSLSKCQIYFLKWSLYRHVFVFCLALAAMCVATSICQVMTLKCSFFCGIKFWSTGPVFTRKAIKRVNEKKNRIKPNGEHVREARGFGCVCSRHLLTLQGTRLLYILYTAIVMFN